MNENDKIRLLTRFAIPEGHCLQGRTIIVLKYEVHVGCSLWFSVSCTQEAEQLGGEKVHINS